MKRTLATVLGLTVLVACSSPTLQLRASGGGSITTAPGNTVSFGGGPVVAQGGPITLEGEASWDSPDLTKVEGIFLVNPDENSGHEPGIVDQLATEQFGTVHRPDGLVLMPGERWFVVMTVSASKPGTFGVPDVILDYGAGRQLVVPMNMTIKAR